MHMKKHGRLRKTAREARRGKSFWGILEILGFSGTSAIRFEDGLDNTGFRKISSYIKLINPNTKIAYIPTANYRTFWGQLFEKTLRELGFEGVSSNYPVGGG